MSHRVAATIQSIMDAKGYSARELAWLGMGGGLLVGWKLTRYAICTIREILSQCGSTLPIDMGTMAHKQPCPRLWASAISTAAPGRREPPADPQ